MLYVENHMSSSQERFEVGNNLICEDTGSERLGHVLKSLKRRAFLTT